MIQVLKEVPVDTTLISKKELIAKIQSDSNICVVALNDKSTRKLVRVDHKYAWVSLKAVHPASGYFDSIASAVDYAIESYEGLTICETLMDLAKWLIQTQGFTPDNLYSEEEIEEAYDNL